MKKPKDLQKKSPPRRYIKENSWKSLIKSFKDEFNRLKQRFNDTRPIEYSISLEAKLEKVLKKK